MELLGKKHLQLLESPGYIPSKKEQIDIYCAVSENSPEGAKKFVTNFCRTIDEHGKSETIPDWDYVLEFVEHLYHRVNLHVLKSRQMTATWIACAFYLWKLQFVPNAFIFYTSRKEQLVDDGGERSTVRSLFGRTRLLYNKLPRFLRHENLEIAHLKMTAPNSGSAIVGESANPDMGRGGNFSDALLDEWAKVPQSESCWAAIDIACPEGKCIMSTFAGPTGNFYRLWKERPSTITFFQVHWSEHPLRAAGLYHDENGKPRSPWYDAKCMTMTADAVARELDMNATGSSPGMIYPQFDINIHVRFDLFYNPDLPLCLGLDFGIGAPCAGGFFQVNGKQMLIISDYEQANLTVEEHAEQLWGLAQGFGYEGTKSEVICYGDPAGNARDMITGSTVIKAFRSAGFTNFHTKKMPRLDRIRLVRGKLHRKEMFFSDRCTILQERVGDYKFPVDDSGNIKSEIPIHNIATHSWDGVGYGAIGAFSLEDSVAAPMREDAVPRRTHPLEPGHLNRSFGSSSHERDEDDEQEDSEAMLVVSHRRRF